MRQAYADVFRRTTGCEENLITAETSSKNIVFYKIYLYSSNFQEVSFRAYSTISVRELMDANRDEIENPLC